jgi:hypothetical protein
MDNTEDKYQQNLQSLERDELLLRLVEVEKSKEDMYNFIFNVFVDPIDNFYVSKNHIDVSCRLEEPCSYLSINAKFVNMLLDDISEMLHYLPSEHPLREKFSLKKEKNENVPPIKLPAREELKVGGIGWEVLELQRILKKQGCYGGPIDGEFGLRTLNSVKLFQGQKDLIQSGVVDQALWKLLYEV